MKSKKIYLPGYEKHKELAKQKLINDDKKEEAPIVAAQSLYYCTIIDVGYLLF